MKLKKKIKSNLQKCFCRSFIQPNFVKNYVRVYLLYTSQRKQKIVEVRYRTCLPLCMHAWTFYDWMFHTVSPNKHVNLVKIFNLSTSAQLDSKVNVLRGCVPASQAEVD